MFRKGTKLSQNALGLDTKHCKPPDAKITALRQQIFRSQKGTAFLKTLIITLSKLLKCDILVFISTDENIATESHDE